MRIISVTRRNFSQGSFLFGVRRED
jgi:hypothetical protein